MKHFTTQLAMLTLAVTLMMIGCAKESEHSQLPEVEVVKIDPQQEESLTLDLIMTEGQMVAFLHREGVFITRKEVSEAMDQRSSEPCKWDFNLDGIVNTADLLELLLEYGVLYDTADLLGFLTAYGVEYIVDVVPVWNNWIQDVNCGLDWDAFPRVKCGDEFQILPPGQQTEWYHTSPDYDVFDLLVGVNSAKMDWKTYGFDEGCNTPESYQPPCNGTQTITCVIHYNGHIYSRTNVGMAQINIPDSLGIPDCIDWDTYEIMSFNAATYEPLQFLVE